MKKAQVIVYDRLLITYYGLYLWSIHEVAGEEGEWISIKCRVPETAPCNGRGTETVVRLKKNECKIL
jgi:hypothetical protein